MNLQLATPLPIHPQPVEEESLESLFVRAAHENVLQPTQLAQSIVSSNNIGCDLLSDSSPLLLELCRCLRVDSKRAYATTYSVLSKVLGEDVRRRGAIRSYSTQNRYCPLCLSHYPIPHFKLVWRLGFVPICLTHRVLLESICPNCKKAINLWAMNPYFDITRCYSCGAKFCDNAHLRYVNASSPGFSAVTTLLSILQGKTAPDEIGWPGDVSGLFDVIKYLIILLDSQQLESEITYKKKMIDTPLTKYKMTTGSTDRTFSAIGNAWQMLEGWLNDKNNGTNGFHSTMEKKNFEKVAWDILIYTNRKDMLHKALGEISKLPAENVSATWKESSARFNRKAKWLSPIYGAIADKQRERKNQIRNKIISRIAEAVDNTPVTRAISLKQLSTIVSIDSEYLRELAMKDERCKELLRIAKDKTEHYYSSLACQNISCAKFNVPFMRETIVESRHFSSTRNVTGVVMSCSQCGERSEINVEAAPLRKDYLPEQEQDNEHMLATSTEVSAGPEASILDIWLSKFCGTVRRDYRYILEGFFQWCGETPESFCERGKIDVNWLLERLNEWQETLRKDGLATQTIKTRYFAVKSFLDSMGVLLPKKHFRYPSRFPTRVKRIYTKEEICKMVCATTSSRNRAIILMLAHTGQAAQVLKCMRYSMISDQLASGRDAVIVSIPAVLSDANGKQCNRAGTEYKFAFGKEVTDAINQMIQERKRKGWVFERDSWLFGHSWACRANKMRDLQRGLKDFPITDGLIQRIISKAAEDAEIQERTEIAHGRTRGALNAIGFRAFFRSQMYKACSESSMPLDPAFVDYLMGLKGNASVSYDRSKFTDEYIIDFFMKAGKHLSIMDQHESGLLQLHSSTAQTDLTNANYEIVKMLDHLSALMTAVAKTAESLSIEVMHLKEASKEQCGSRHPDAERLQCYQ